MNIIQDPDAFGRLVAALEPWLDQVVIIGGWAQQLYRLHPHAQQLDYAPLTTLDTDVAVPGHLTTDGEDIRGRLLGDDHPPATHYILDYKSTGFYAEFLTPLVGSEYDRNGRRKATLEVAGIVSQKLRYLEVLLHEPWVVDFENRGDKVGVQIPNPVSYVAQKILIRGKRKPEDRAKDILYMHDTFEVFGARLPELADLWRDTVAPKLSRRAVATVSKAEKALFGELTEDIRRSSEIPAARKLSPGAIRELCQYGFRHVFQ